jgi:hypothetical protein
LSEISQALLHKFCSDKIIYSVKSIDCDLKIMMMNILVGKLKNAYPRTSDGFRPVDV